MIAEVCDHAADGADGAFTVLSAKYSSARGIAERVTNLVARKLGKRVRPSRTATTVLPGAGIADHEALAIENGRELDLDLPIATIRHLIARYAERAPAIIELMHARPALRDPLTPTEPTLGAEIVHVIQHEMALTLGGHRAPPDAARQRRPPGCRCPSRQRTHCRAELDWDQERVAQEIAAVEKAVYRIVAATFTARLNRRPFQSRSTRRTRRLASMSRTARSGRASKSEAPRRDQGSVNPLNT